MKVLVIGGSGFLSGTTARRCAQAGHETWGLSRGNRPLPDGVTSITADRKDRPQFARTVRDAGVRWDLVIDCIGFEADDAKQDLDVFTGLADQLVFISTDFTLDPHQRPWHVDETYSRFATTGYGAKKRACEELLLSQQDIAVTVLRPCHIYGPGSKLGCLPLHGRDDQLIEHLRQQKPVRLVGGGHFLQQPVFADDVARMALSCAGNSLAHGQIYFAAGPDTVASWMFYQLIADELGVPLKVEEAPITPFLAENPGKDSFCCHRVYCMDKGRSHGLALPTTTLREGLQQHLASMR